MTTPLLQIRNLSAGYVLEEGVTRTVRGVSLTLEEGEILGIAGESGCGKSTLIQSVLRILSPPGVITGGKVLYRGQDVLQMNGEELRAMRWDEISLVFQQAMNALNPTLTVWEQLRDTLAVSEPPETHEARARELLEQVEVAPSFLRAYPHELSGGMRQRVVIAIALARRPRLLLMDEPTTALDVVVQRGILQRIQALQRQENFSVILITHDLGIVARVADKVQVMYAGATVEEGPCETVFGRPLHPYTRGLLGARPNPKAAPRDAAGRRRRLPTIPGVVPSLDHLPAGCRFAG